MKRVYIIHGWEGDPEEGWFPWLKKELESEGFEVFVPAMPDTNVPVIGKWVSHLAIVVGAPNEDTYFVGHSIGCQAILRYLETLENKRVGGAVMVAGWLMRLTGDLSPEEIVIAKPWIETPINYSKIKEMCPKIVAIFSDNDEFVHSDNQKFFRDRLNAKIIIEHAKGHFSGSDRVTELPEVVEAIKSFT